MKTFFRSLYFRLTRGKRSAGAVKAAQTRKRNRIASVALVSNNTGSPRSSPDAVPSFIQPQE